MWYHDGYHVCIFIRILYICINMDVHIFCICMKESFLAHGIFLDKERIVCNLDASVLQGRNSCDYQMNKQIKSSANDARCPHQKATPVSGTGHALGHNHFREKFDPATTQSAGAEGAEV